MYNRAMTYISEHSQMILFPSGLHHISLGCYMRVLECILTVTWIRGWNVQFPVFCHAPPAGKLYFSETAFLPSFLLPLHQVP